MSEPENALQIRNCPPELKRRVKAKAALIGKSRDEWVVQLLERETNRLRPLQKDYAKEDEDRNKDDGKQEQ